ncbi:hypothetical protein C4568_00770 [Candidatus Parcubacteria bacterium]|nr:MAG: hypothetical protein C4568_00770 [Candidatus Parcubacteria bacterium]
MYKDRRLSDYDLFLGAVFVVCVFVGVGVWGSNGTQRTAKISAQTAAASGISTAPSTGATSAAKPTHPCLQDADQKNANTSNGVDYKCLNGCTYTVKIGFGASLSVVPEGKPDPKGKPGQVFYEPLIGGKKGPVQCAAGGTVASTAQGGWNDLNSRAFAYQASVPAGSTATGNPTNLLSNSNWTGSQSYSSAINSGGSTGSNIFNYQTICDSNGVCTDYQYIGAEGFRASPGDQGFVGPAQPAGGTTGDSVVSTPIRTAGDDPTWGDMSEYDPFKTAGDDPTWGDITADSDQFETAGNDSTWGDMTTSQTKSVGAPAVAGQTEPSGLPPGFTNIGSPAGQLNIMGPDGTVYHSYLDANQAYANSIAPPPSEAAPSQPISTASAGAPFGTSNRSAESQGTAYCSTFYGKYISPGCWAFGYSK